MSVNIPPEPNVNTFNNLYWIQGDVPLTTAEGDLRYLKFPVAQGTENLQAINVNGVLTANSGVNFTSVNPPTSSQVIPASNDSSTKIPTTAWVQSAITGASSNTLTDVLIAGNNAGSQPIDMNNQNISAVNTLSFATTSQTSAYTGGVAGSYTNTSMTIDANGKISAISSGSPSSIPFAPIFANFANYQTGTTGYSAGTYINWSGTWGANDYAMFRITAQANYGNTGTGWQNFVSTSGVLILRPYYAPVGVWSSSSSNPAIYPNNTNNANIGSTGKAIYYTGAINNGTQTFFFLYGTTNYIQLSFNAPTLTGGWLYTHLLEYICHSTSGGSITLSGGSGTNNSLP